MQCRLTHATLKNAFRVIITAVARVLVAAAGTTTLTRTYQMYASYLCVLFLDSDGSYYYKNTNGSTYYNNGKGDSRYTSPSGETYKKSTWWMLCWWSFYSWISNIVALGDVITMLEWFCLSSTIQRCLFIFLCVIKRRSHQYLQRWFTLPLG